MGYYAVQHNYRNHYIHTITLRGFLYTPAQNITFNQKTGLAEEFKP